MLVNYKYADTIPISLDSYQNQAYKRQMARIARVVAPGMPHHVIQRGNRQQQTFFNDDDYRFYQTLLTFKLPLLIHLNIQTRFFS
jgi:hypothetical protein